MIGGYQEYGEFLGGGEGSGGMEWCGFEVELV
jgi:hypothetical protein